MVVNKLSRLFIICSLIYPLPVLADHVPTQEPYGYEQTINAETGDLTIRLKGSDGFEDSPPEKYTIFFGMATGVDANSFCISTSFGHEVNAWNDHVFSIANLRTYFELPVGTFYYRVRSDNDTDNSYSTISAERSIALPDQVPFNETQTDWSAPTTTCNDTSTTTTTVPPPAPEPEPEPEPEPPPPPPPVIVEIGGEEVEYTQSEVDDGTVERDMERLDNLEEYGCEMTDAQIERGDCMIIEEEEIEEEIYETELTEEGELLEDDVIVLEVADDNEIEIIEVIELTEEEEVILEIEEYIEEIEEFEIEVIIIEEEIDLIDILIDNDIFPPDPEDVLKDLESVQDELREETDGGGEPEDTIIVAEEPPIEEIKEEVLTEEIIEEEIIEIETIVEDITEEIIEELETEEVIEVIEEVNDIGVQNLSEATQETQEIVQAVVEEAIEDIEELTEEQVEVVAEVLGLEETEDVAIIAEAAETDTVVAQAVEEYVERAVENKEVENYTLADVVTEVQYEEFLENPIETFVNFDNLEEITIANIGDDMTTDQREKAQEVVVPVILTRIVSMAAFVLRKS